MIFYVALFALLALAVLALTGSVTFSMLGFIAVMGSAVTLVVGGLFAGWFCIAMSGRLRGVDLVIVLFFISLGLVLGWYGYQNRPFDFEIIQR